MCKREVGIQLKIVGGKYLKATLCVKKITLNKAGQKGGDDGPSGSAAWSVGAAFVEPSLGQLSADEWKRMHPHAVNSGTSK